MTEMYSGLHVGQRFSSLEEFKTAIRSISVRQHWELRVVRSNKKSVVIGCRSAANCFFRAVCRSNKNTTYITSLQDSHGCRRSAESPASTPARSEASHVRFLLSEIPRLFDMKTRIRGQDVVDAVKRYHGYDISMRQAQRALTKLQPRHMEYQSEQVLDIDQNGGDQHSPGQSQLESPGEGGPAYRAIADDRWLPDNLQHPLSEEENVEQTGSRANHEPAPPRAHPQPVSHPPLVQHQPQIGSSTQSMLNYNPRPMNSSQPGVGYASPAALAVANSEQPKPPSFPPRADHPTVSQVVITDFKIEFSCTTCGALNQSFFPNQGNVTGGNYMPHHPSQNNPTRQTGPGPQNGPDNTSNSAGANAGYDVNSNTRTMPTPWAAGGLGVPIGPAPP